MKRLQNRIATAGLTLPVASACTLAVWVLAGLFTHGLWPQLACFVAAVYMLIELSNGNALLRVRSRMVSTVFMFLSCSTCFLFPSLSGAVVQMCYVAAMLLLFTTYQNAQAAGRVFYASAFIGLSSMVWVQSLCLTPVLWVLMGSQLQSLSWRTLAASVIGLIAPYWIALLFLLWQQDFTPLTEHFTQLAKWPFPPDCSALTISHIAALALVVLLLAVSTVHFWTHSFEDKIRTRLLYGLLTVLSAVVLIWLVLQPQHYDVLMRLLLLFASPLIAHYFTLTNSRLTNIVFITSTLVSVAITAYNLWTA